MLGRAIASREEPFVLVLDDLHNLCSPEALAVVTAVADTVPAGSQVVVAGREEPPHPDRAPARARASGRSPRARPRHDPERGDRDARPDGSRSPAGGRPGRRSSGPRAGRPVCTWPAARSRAGRTSTPGWRASEATTGWSPTTCATRCWTGSTPNSSDSSNARRCYVELSVLLCDAVLQRTGSGSLLRDISRSNLLVVPLDSSDGSYRYHALLAGMLEAELRRADPDRHADLHRRASAWYAEAGDHERAADHAIEAGDPALAGDAAVGHRGASRCSPAAAPTSGAGWIASLAIRSRRTRRSRSPPRPSTSRSASAIWQSTSPPRRERAVTDSDVDASLAAGVETMRAAVARDGVEQMRRDAARAYEGSPEDSPWRSLCCLLRGVGDHLLGDADHGPRPPGGGRAARRDRGPERAGAVPRAAGADRDRCQRLGAGAAARHARSVPGRPRRPGGASDVRARLRGLGAGARAPRPRRGRPGGPATRVRPADHDSSTTSPGTTSRRASCWPGRRSAWATSRARARCSPRPSGRCVTTTPQSSFAPGSPSCASRSTRSRSPSSSARRR